MYLRKIAIKLIFIQLSLLSACNIPADSPYPSIQPQRIDSSKIQGRASAVAFVIGSKGYVAFGRTTGNVFLSSFLEFDPETNHWTEKSDFPGPKRVKAVAATVGNRAYAGLGLEENTSVYQFKGYLRDWYCYQPDLDKWQRKADFPDNMVNGCACFSYGKNIYVVTGNIDTCIFKRRCFKYDTEKDSWTRLNDFPGVVRACAVACATSSRVYLGTGYDKKNLNDWWEYFPVQDKWVKRKSLPDNGRENAVALAIGERIFVASGRHFAGEYTGGKLFKDILEYDIEKNVWYMRTTMTVARENAVAFSINGKGYIGFGEDLNGNILNDFYCFNP